jgi:hypothetical protein
MIKQKDELHEDGSASLTPAALMTHVIGKFKMEAK